MGTGYIELFPGGYAPDKSGSGNQHAGLSYQVSTGVQTANTPKVSQLLLLFDPTIDEHWMFSFLIPGDWASGATLHGVLKCAIAITGNIIMKGGQFSSVDGSTNDLTALFTAADLSAAIAAPGVIGQTVSFTIALTTTGMAINRKCIIFIGRDADHASDTTTGDVELLSLNLEYTL